MARILKLIRLLSLVDLAIVWGAILLFDILVFLFTINRMRSVAREWRGSLLNLMLRDGEHALVICVSLSLACSTRAFPGALYFGVLVLCHSTNILTYLLARVGISRLYPDVH